MNKIKLENLTTRFLGKDIEYYEEIDSTQDEIYRKINANRFENGNIVIANIQTKGKRYSW